MSKKIAPHAHNENSDQNRKKGAYQAPKLHLNLLGEYTRTKALSNSYEAHTMRAHRHSIGSPRITSRGGTISYYIGVES
jgi:hypothetical protein